VPFETSVSTIHVFSSTKRAGRRARSKRTLCDPDPFRPSVSPQSSSIVQAVRGATKSRIGGGLSPVAGANVWPM